MQAYFLIDNAKAKEQNIFILEKQINELITELEREPQTRARVWIKVISMEAAVCQIIEQTASNQVQLLRRPPGCAFGEALQLIEDLLEDETTPGQAAAFVFLRNEPTGAWRNKLKSLKAQHQVKFHFYLFEGETGVDSKIITEIKTRWADEQVNLKLFTLDTVSWVFKNKILPILKTAVNLPPPPRPQAAPKTAPPVGAKLSGEAEINPPEITVPEEIKLPPPEIFDAEITFDEKFTSPAQQVMAEESAMEIKEPPPVDKGGVATIWKDLPPPEDDDWSPPNKDIRTLPAANNWHIIGASRRGKMHAHKGIFREDALALGQADGWQLMVVADGGGSCSLSRVGSKLAAETAITAMTNLIKEEGQKTPAAEICQKALTGAIEMAWKALETEAARRKLPLREFGTTFLAVMHRPDESNSILGVAQVGDGLVAARWPDGTVTTLAEPDVGATAGVTFFLTSKPWPEWLERVHVETLADSPQVLAAMCDGVADDFIPFNEHLPKLFDKLEQVLEQEQPAESLFELLGYEKRGSFDDRTLALMYRPEIETETGPKVEVETKPDFLDAATIKSPPATG